ncbi:hypothetical protein SELMODRAFT_180460 [Selaginella moellendorffii]|uniref:Tr-type G domain-containing protein n=2 Tax=Selaginella moellendorffii TaxID=88036 RepID=D8SK70_SELML|nr:uncharacterized protein LOC9644160 isoform X1 [Selaginella moellendorffii]EFJ15282.1 hypothetical protein SELMODRAFT_180460 [Selaginella moellendorffii]|eukprot:XP_002983786.1 uncharacterized protein LOC9644160 isoform X1 [Selaginella moellendorffii]
MLRRALWSATADGFCGSRAAALWRWSRHFAVAAASSADSNPAERVTSPSLIRNLAVIAHVDHGKTTLMDRLLRQCGAIVARDRTLDSITLERERGITIASKYTSMIWGTSSLNIVDTPGHADFGGEVERVIGMVDGAVLVVDAGEGPLAQTKFVVAKALKSGIRPILLLNKVDRPSVTEERCGEVESMVFDLFANLGATEEQLDFPVLYASAKEGWASSTFTKAPEGEPTMAPLLDTIVKYVPPPKCDLHAPFQMVVTMMEHDPYFGRILTGRIYSGTVKPGDRVHGIRKKEDTDISETFNEGKIVKILKKKGVASEVADCAGAGDIVSIAGLAQPYIGNTVASVEVKEALPAVKVDPPTISMTFSVNDSPLAGKDGKQLTGPKIGDRLKAEEESNVSIKVLRSTSNDAYEVQGRGELQLGILIENMRREGFELSVSPPAVLYKTENGQKLEPIEELRIEVNDEHSGTVIESLTHRRAELLDMSPCPESVGRTTMTFTCPSRGLVGYRSSFSTITHGTGFMHRAFLSYDKFRGPVGNVRRGVLVSTAQGVITAYALMGLESRGTMFVPPGDEAYEGMIVGEHCRDADLDVNPVKAKELTNIRAPGKDENVKLTPPRLVTLEEAIGYVAADELIEVTPKAIRLRKKYLDSTKRKAAARKLSS